MRDSSGVEPGKQLDELLGYQKTTDHCSFRNDSTEALLLQRIGWLFTTKNNFFNAVQYTQKSIDLVNQQKNNPAINPASVIKSYWNLHYIYDSLKLETKKRAAVDSCISYAVYLNTGYNYALAAIEETIPNLFSMGDYFRCLSYATLGESITNKTSATLMLAADNGFAFFDWKVNALIFLKKTAEAEKLLSEKIRFAEYNRKTVLLAALYGLYASVLRENGNPVQAVEYFKKSLKYNQQIGYIRGCAEALNNIGFTYSTILYQNKTAIQYYFRALNFADSNESLNILDNIANMYAQGGSYDSAFHYFKKAFNQLRPGFTETDLLKNNDDESLDKIADYITGMVLDKAAACLAKYKATGLHTVLEEAINIYGVMDRYFDRLKVSQSDIQSKLFWKTNNHRLYEQAIEACYENHNTDKAFYFFEKSRSILLNDQILEQHGMDDGDIAKQAQLKKNIQEIEKNLQNITSSSKNYLLLQQKLFSNKQELQTLINNINSQHPSLKNNSDTGTLTLEVVRKSILNNSKTMLELFCGDSAVYVLIITVNNQSFAKINKQSYDSLTNSFNSFITNPDRNNNFKGFVKTAHKLYHLLFNNIVLPAGSIIISPDGVNYPFEALVINDDAKNPDYFLQHYATSYTYSAKYLTNRFSVNTSTSNKILGIAPVEYGGYQNLAALSGSDISLKNINNYFSNATNYILGKATKNNFEENFPDYNIIQLYTHAADNSINNDPVIYFSDSALYLSDLIPYRKPLTQLVVLSACETAKGKLFEGEGIFCFNRGFAALGIPAAVSNLWSVDNVSTYSITELFYKYLSQGLPTDIALQKAKLEFINTSDSKEKKLPYFWAGAILTGKADVIKCSDNFSWNVFIGSSILLIAIARLIQRYLI